MKKYEELLNKANKEIEVSDHLLYKTFSLIKDTKFLIAITKHVIDSSKFCLEGLLEYEKYWKRIGAYPDSYGFQINIFERKLRNKYKLDPKYTKLMTRLLELEVYIKESPIRFKRKDKYVLSTEDYKTRTLDIDKVKRYIHLVKNFINDVNDLIEKKENGKFGRSKKEIGIR